MLSDAYNLRTFPQAIPKICFFVSKLINCFYFYFYNWRDHHDPDLFWCSGQELRIISWIALTCSFSLFFNSFSLFLDALPSSESENLMCFINICCCGDNAYSPVRYSNFSVLHDDLLNVFAATVSFIFSFFIDGNDYFLYFLWIFFEKLWRICLKKVLSKERVVPMTENKYYSAVDFLHNLLKS